jgi:hypothetical protein
MAGSHTVHGVLEFLMSIISTRQKSSVGWGFVTNESIGFILQVTAMPGFHSLYDWCYQAM